MSRYAGNTKRNTGEGYMPYGKKYENEPLRGKYEKKYERRDMPNGKKYENEPLRGKYERGCNGS